MDHLVIQIAVILLSPWKPVLILGAFIGWGWFLTNKIIPEAHKYELDPTKWTNTLMSCGGAALLFLLLPITFTFWFWIGFPILLGILFIPVLLYLRACNQAGVDILEKTKPGLIKKLTTKKEKDAQDISFRLKGIEGELDPPKRNSEQLPAYLAIQTLLANGITARSYRTDILITKEKCKAIWEIDGVAKNIESPSPKTALQMIALLKKISGLNPKEQRQKQIGDFNLRTTEHNITFTIESSGGSKGIHTSFYANKKEAVRKTIDKIGLTQKQIQQLSIYTKEENRKRLILLASPPRHGLTTSLYSLASMHDPYHNNIITLETNIETDLEGVTHTLIKNDPDSPGAGRQFTSIVRRDPEVALFGLIKDPEEAQAIANAAAWRSGRPFTLAGIHAATALQAVQKWTQLVQDQDKAFDGLRGVLVQRSIRTLCTACKKAFKPGPSLTKSGLPLEGIEKLYKPGKQIEKKNIAGTKLIECSFCSGTGYRGRTSVFEFMPFNKEAQEFAKAGNWKAARSIARKNNMVLLSESGWKKVISGITSVEEYARVIQGSNSKKKSTPAKRTKK